MTEKSPLHAITRRHFFRDCAVGVGKAALASLLVENAARAAAAAPGPHFPARAKSVIFLFMAGGPSQFELFDYKPKLQELDGEPIPQSFIDGKRFAFMDSSFMVKQPPKLLATTRKFARYGQSGV